MSKDEVVELGEWEVDDRGGFTVTVGELIDDDAHEMDDKALARS